MNFLFDLIASQPNNDGDFHGGGKYAKKIFFALMNRLSSGVKIYAVFDSSRHLDEEISEMMKKNNVGLIDVRGKTIGNIIEEYAIQKLYSALPFGLIKYNLYDAFNLNCRIYCTIHGLRNLEVKAGMDALEYYSFTDIKGKIRALVKNIGSAQVIQRDVARYNQLFEYTTVFTVSNHTKYSILSCFPEKKGLIDVFYSPDVTEFESTSTTGPENDFEQQNYFLLISGNRWLKNNMRSILALDQLLSERTEIQQNVIVTGVNQPQIFLQKIKNKNRFIFYNYVSEAFLRKLYRNSYAFIYMSLNEGFGYPPLDAMKIGKPVLTSPLTSIPEICGDSVLYANPYSVLEIKNRILQLLNSEIYNQLSRKSQERYQMINDRQKDDLDKMVRILLTPA